MSGRLAEFVPVFCTGLGVWGIVPQALCKAQPFWLTPSERILGDHPAALIQNVRQGYPRGRGQGAERAEMGSYQSSPEINSPEFLIGFLH
eukprot:745141-Amphidinium_carterae.1